MFGLFKKKKPVTLMDKFILEAYGNPPPPKRANIYESVDLAFNVLLGGVVDKQLIHKQATALNAGPIPYSTHDLAIATSLAFFKNDGLRHQLFINNLSAQMAALEWLQTGKANRMLVKSFSDTLQQLYP